ncbi:MAG: 2Fe-2S iron-sulfur cluster binding domain-containing protein [Burkholderiales bacterium]|nr:2Fe-2S iron-sulfur cluster binding domain-containing protein [Burkholderiales bacterium]
MNAVELLSLIAAAWLLQLAVGVAVVLRRRSHTRSTASAPPFAPSQHRAEQAWEGWRPMRVIHRQAEDACGSQCSFHLQPVDGQPLPPFRPGQFLTFSLDLPGQERALTRCYSLSDAPQPSHYRVTIKRVPAPPDQPQWPPGLSSGHFHDQVQVGTILRVKAPAGHFVLDPDPGVPAVLIGGGIGITPMMSMLRWCLAMQPQRQVHLYYGLRHSGERAFKSDLEALAAAHPALSLHVVYSRPAPTDVLGRDYQHVGHIDGALLRTTLPHGRHQFYLCGPAALMQVLVPALAEWGVPRSDVHYEAFGPASVAWPGAQPDTMAVAQDIEIRFARSGRTLRWDGGDGTLLDCAERHGVAVESACRCGGCGSCETRVLAGEVTYDQPPDHEPAPGHCLLCVGRPSANLVLEA